MGSTERVSSATAERAQRRVAGALAQAGLAAGDRVVFLCPSSVQLLLAVLGALRVGVVAVPLNPSLLPHERQLLVDDAQASLVISSPAALSALAEGPEADLAPVPLARPMHYTSGTTGRPKGVWSGVLSERNARLLFQEEAELWGFAPDDVNLTCSPLWHSAPLRFAGGTLLAGGDVVVVPKFKAEAALAAISRHRPTTAFMVPAHLQRLFAAGALSGSSAELDSFRLLAHAGAPCPEPLKRAALHAFPKGSVWEFYGSTEGQFTACSPGEWLTHPGTVGRARPHRQLSVDPDGTIWCQVPDYARFTYWRDPSKTAAAWRGDAFTVRDLGRLDDEGYLYLDGRRDDLVITGGVNVYPAEVEQALLSCPGVLEVAVFGVRDERWGQRVCAAVVGDVDVRHLLDHVQSRLAPYKRPKDIYLLAELPHTSTGKVKRQALPEVLGLAEAEASG